MSKECLELSIASCKGCNIAEMATQSIKELGAEAGIVKAEQIKRVYCPEKAQMTLPREPKKSIW